MSSALAQLQIEILDERAACPSGSAEAHAVDGLLEATAVLREAFDQFVQAATLNTRAHVGAAATRGAWAGERA